MNSSCRELEIRTFTFGNFKQIGSPLY